MFNRNHAAATSQVFALHLSQSPGATITGFFRTQFRAIAAWHNQRRERQRLLEYLASDPRAAADIGYPHRLP